MIRGRWLPLHRPSVHHGRVHGVGGDAWIYPRCHSGAGLFVEVHLDQVDGPLVARQRVSHISEATSLVDELRDAFRESGRSGVSEQIDELRPRGLLVLHRPRYLIGGYPSPKGQLEEGPTISLCAHIWADPGPRRVTTGQGVDDRSIHPSFRQTVEVEVLPYSISEFQLGWMRFNRLFSGTAIGHRCRLPTIPAPR